jgi:hypothetical protein
MKQQKISLSSSDHAVLVDFVVVGTYMVSIVVTIRVLNSSPLDGSALRRNHSNLGTFFQKPTIEEARRDTEWTASANIDGFHLFDKVHEFNRFFFFVEISSIINELLRNGKCDKKSC